MNYEIDISIDLPDADINAGELHRVLATALSIERVDRAVLSVTIVDNATIHRLNREHLNHDYPTDVISFGLDWSHPDRDQPGEAPDGRARGAAVEGEIIASLEYGQTAAEQFGWDAQSELTLYAVHGMLHICGYDDLTPAEQSVMRAREHDILTRCGILPAAVPVESDGAPGPHLPDSVQSRDRRSRDLSEDPFP